MIELKILVAFGKYSYDHRVQEVIYVLRCCVYIRIIITSFILLVQFIVTCQLSLGQRRYENSIQAQLNVIILHS